MQQHVPFRRSNQLSTFGRSGANRMQVWFGIPFHLQHSQGSWKDHTRPQSSERPLWGGTTEALSGNSWTVTKGSYSASFTLAGLGCSWTRVIRVKSPSAQTAPLRLERRVGHEGGVGTCRRRIREDEGVQDGRRVDLSLDSGDNPKNTWQISELQNVTSSNRLTRHSP